MAHGLMGTAGVAEKGRFTQKKWLPVKAVSMRAGSVIIRMRLCRFNCWLMETRQSLRSAWDIWAVDHSGWECMGGWVVKPASA